jgi:hypothetical protein
MGTGTMQWYQRWWNGRNTQERSWRKGENGEELVARGEQELGCMRRAEGATELEPALWPDSLREALRPYGER